MNTEDTKEKQTSNGDPFSLLMFGPSQRTTDINNDSQDMQKEKETNNHSSIDDWLFGNRHSSNTINNESMTSQAKINQILNNLDFVALMDNIDTLVQSAQQLKPLYSKVSPMIKQIFKK